MAIARRRRADGAGASAPTPVARADDGNSNDTNNGVAAAGPAADPSSTRPPPPPPPPRILRSSSSALPSSSPSSLPEAHLDAARLEPYRHLPWIVYRGRAYDLSSFRDAHPGGRFLVDLAVHRDATALVESYHLRSDFVRRAIEGSGGGSGAGPPGGGFGGSGSNSNNEDKGGGGLLPVIKNFPVDAVEAAPRPDDSELYVAIKRRVRAEVFGLGQGGKQGQQGQQQQQQQSPQQRLLHPRRGSEHAVACVLISASLAYFLFALFPSVVTGALLGLTAAWIGVTVQHCGNHGAMGRSALLNLLLGFTDDLIGGSSLVWRYHHQVSHHIHTNDGRLDEDVASMYPLLRFDARLPRKKWHQWQHLYVWLLYPAMHTAFQWGDLAALASGRTPGARMSGARLGERAALVLGKALHFSGLLLVPAVGVPWLLGGSMGGGAGAWAPAGGGGGGGGSAWATTDGDEAAAPAPPPPPPSGALAAAAPGDGGGVGSGGDPLLLAPAFLTRWPATLRGALAYSVVLSFVLALMFFVSHSVPENKPLRDDEDEGEKAQEEQKEPLRPLGRRPKPHAPARAALLAHPAPAARDWGLQQVVASSNWGGDWANLLTGGLSLQIEHHLFPAVAFHPHYPRIALVVADECAKRGVPYSSHASLLGILRRFYACMRELGSAEDEPGGHEAGGVSAGGEEAGRRPRFAVAADAVSPGAAAAAAEVVRAACDEVAAAR